MMHFTPGLMTRISSNRAKSSSTVLSGLVITTPNDRIRNRCRASASPAEYSMGKAAAESASPISRLTWASVPITRTRLIFALRLCLYGGPQQDLNLEPSGWALLEELECIQQGVVNAPCGGYRYH